MNGQNALAAQHADNIFRRVGAGPHANVLENVGEEPCAPDHASSSTIQVLLQQDQVADSLQCRPPCPPRCRCRLRAARARSVDAVSPWNPRRVPCPASARTIRCLWAVDRRAKSDCLLRRASSRRYLLHRVAQQHGIGREPHVAADLAELIRSVWCVPVRIFTPTPWLLQRA